MGLREIWFRGADFAGRHKFLSFALLFGSIYLASYPFGEPYIPTAKQRSMEGSTWKRE